MGEGEYSQRLPHILVLPDFTRLVENVQLRVLGGPHVVHARALVWVLIGSCFGFRKREGSGRSGLVDWLGIGEMLGLRLRLGVADVLGVHGHDGSGSWSCWWEGSGGFLNEAWESREGSSEGSRVGREVAGTCAPNVRS